VGGGFLRLVGRGGGIKRVGGNRGGGGGLADRAVNCVCNLCIKLVP